MKSSVWAKYDHCETVAASLASVGMRVWLGPSEATKGQPGTGMGLSSGSDTVRKNGLINARQKIVIRDMTVPPAGNILDMLSLRQG
jgi:hypothetical protein